jgi:pyruvate,water dikinase
MNFIKTFSQISKKDVKQAGGKGASLGEMASAGLPVPLGFVILAGAFDRFLRENELPADVGAILKKVNHKDINSVDKASAEIRRMILDEDMPKDLQTDIVSAFKKLNTKLVAVRSSATAEDSQVASWAGELETYLNINENRLIASVKKCWASLFTPRAIFYRIEKRLHKQRVSVAVVVQKMVQSEISGVCFTVHPVTEDRNQMVIEAVFGLGESIVGGQVTPDSYIVRKQPLKIFDVSVNKQPFAIVKTATGTSRQKLSDKIGGRQKLTAGQIIKLAEICQKIENHYRFPQDIEWAYEKGKFYITQSRPITTL